MKLRLEFDGRIGIFTVVGYYKNKDIHTEWSLFPCKSLALFTGLPVTSTVLDAVIMLNRNDEYYLVLTITNISSEEQVHNVILSDVPKTVSDFPTT